MFASKPKKVLAWIILLSVTHCAVSEKILAVTFMSTKSHKITYMGLLEELARRGHQITIVSPVKASKEIANITEIYTLDVFDYFGSWNPFSEERNTVNQIPFLMTELWEKVCRLSYELPQVKQLLNEKFDLVFVQPLFNDCVYGLVYRLNAPFVLFTPTATENFMANRIGGHLPPAVVPNIFSGIVDDMNFFQRCKNLGITILLEAILRFYYEPQVTTLYREMLGQDIPSSSEIMGNASLILSNGHFSLSKPRPFYNDVIEVGGIHSRPAKPLPKELEDFVTKKGSDGFILFSMGSAITASQMPEEKRKKFINVFKRLKQQVLWKWETETMPDLPENVKLSKWVPQQDVLGHPNIKLFITHCGMGGTEESIYHGVPLVGFPMFGDQPINAKRANSLGFLLELDWSTFTEDDLYNAIQEILNNHSYRDSVKKLSAIFKDQIDDPLDRAVWWVEYVMRHKGAPQLRSAGRNLNFFQYHSLDVIGLFALILSATLYIDFLLIRCLIRKCMKSKSKPVDAKKKKK